jgi:hypothetical protein
MQEKHVRINVQGKHPFMQKCDGLSVNYPKGRFNNADTTKRNIDIIQSCSGKEFNSKPKYTIIFFL